MLRLIESLVQKGRVDHLGDMLSFAEIKKLLGLDAVLGLRERVSGVKNS